MIICGAPTGRLQVDGVNLHCPAWTMPDLLELWFGADVRGDDQLIPGLGGVIANRRRTTVTRHSLPMTICGDVDRNGARYDGDAWAGLEQNIDYLRTNVVDPTNTGDGTRAATLFMPSGDTRTADIHVLRLVPGARGYGVQSDGWTGAICTATLEISIPLGVFS